MIPSSASLEAITAIVEGLPVGIWVARAPSGELLYANRAFREILGTEAREDVTAGAYAEPYGIYDPSGTLYPENRMPFVRALCERATVTVDDLVIHRPDGRRVNLRAEAKPLYDPDGQVGKVVVAFVDITREVEAQRVTEEAERRMLHAQKTESIGKLAGGIAHDFNNLLASLRVLTSLLRAKEVEPAKLDALAQMELVVDSATLLTRGLLDFARRDPPSQQSIPVNDVARRLVALIERTFGDKVKISASLTATPDRVRGDASRLEQVVMNLLMNAREAMPDGGALSLVSRTVTLDEEAARAHPPLRPGAYYALDVVDTGVGIPPALRRKVFEPYFTTKNAGQLKGTGLGLATALGIVETHGGVIEVVPTPNVRGTTMRVYLPLAEPPAATDASGPTA